MQAFATLPKDIEKNSDEWERWCNNEASEKAPMPGEWSKISDFRQLLIVRALKPGRITNALQAGACTDMLPATAPCTCAPLGSIAHPLLSSDPSLRNLFRHPAHVSAPLLQNFCEKRMGSRYVNQDAFSPPVVMSEASSSTPIFFILFPGYSPSKEIEAYAATVGKTVASGNLTLISMGQASLPSALCACSTGPHS